MAYSKKFVPEKYEVISNVVEAVGNLTPGRSIVVTNPDPEARERTRYLVYDYFHHMNLKNRFRLKMVGSALIIQKLGFRVSSEVTTTGGELNQEKIHRLIDLWGEAEAKASLESWIEAGEISASEGVELWEHVKRIMS